MKKRIINLRDEIPLLNIVSYGRAHHPLTPAQRAHIALTVRRVPEVMVKVSGGARTLAGVGKHMSYVGREGKLGMETDTGEKLDGYHFEKKLIDDWNLDVEAHQRQTSRSILGRKPPKLVHNIIFSMPPGTPPKKVLQAVRKLALNEWQLKHRYAMTLHTDDNHPHVHVVLKAMGEDGRRLNIRKATLRSWRAHFAANLRELGVAANATERAVRGESRSRKSDGIFRADQRGQSHHVQARQREVMRELATGSFKLEPGAEKLRRTRMDVIAGWEQTAARLRASGDYELADRIGDFTHGMPPPLTEKEWLVERVRQRERSPDTGPRTWSR